MHPRSMLTVAVIAMFATACAIVNPGASGAEQQHEQARQTLAQRQDAFFNALSARDADAASAMFAESAVLHVANMPPVTGRAVIEQFHRRMFGFLAESQATAEHIDVADGRDMAISIGSTSNAFRGADGLVRYAGKYSLAWRQVEGEWLIVLYSVSSNQADAAR